MKKKILKIVITILMSCFMLAFGLLAGCKCNESDPIIFGKFGYNGNYLTQRAVGEEISASEAKNTLSSNFVTTANAFGVAGSDDAVVPVPSNIIDSVCRKYAALNIKTKYYTEGVEDKQSKNDRVAGTDLFSTLERNRFSPFAMLEACNIVIFPEMIDFMEQENANFRASAAAVKAPFKNIFSYYLDENGNMVIHCKDFADIPASVGGGIGCYFLQETEIVYDAENKISFWQTSLGIYTQSPKGTMQQGYILEIEFDWEVKQ